MDTDSFEVVGNNPRTGARVAIGDPRGEDEWYVYVWGRGDVAWRTHDGPFQHSTALEHAEGLVQGGNDG
jgi:hypothetical protein